jgi:hypothetical protein
LVSQNSAMLSRIAREVARPLETLLEDLLDQAGLTAAVTVVEHESRDSDRRPTKDAVKRSGGTTPAMLVWMPISSGGAGSAAAGSARPPAIASTTIAPQSPPCATNRS